MFNYKTRCQYTIGQSFKRKLQSCNFTRSRQISLQLHLLFELWPHQSKLFLLFTVCSCSRFQGYWSRNTIQVYEECNFKYIQVIVEINRTKLSERKNQPFSLLFHFFYRLQGYDSKLQYPSFSIEPFFNWLSTSYFINIKELEYSNKKKFLLIGF